MAPLLLRPGVLVPDAETQPVVEWIVQHVIHGWSVAAVVRELNRRNIPAPQGGW
jgi:hypothetical protein